MAPDNSSMPTFDKSSGELVSFFNDLMADFPQAEIRKTFGYPCAYVHGHMSAGLHAESMFLRLNPEDAAEFLKIPGAIAFAPMSNRPMKGYVVVPESLRKSRPRLKAWITKALANAASLPPKVKKGGPKKS